MIIQLSSALAKTYRIERELGAGGMATVYLAHDIKHDRKVAVKVLRPELAAVIGAERFLHEIKTTANLQHPHILPLHDSGEADSFLYYVMPFVEGESLRARIEREKQLPIADAIRIATEVAGALDYAHRHGVVHRDIKPENILLHEGRALVADFGIALAVQEAGAARLTQTGMSLGTPQYMAPEQAMGEKNIDARADIYALAVVLYEMLVGEPPFTGPTAQSILAKLMTTEPASLAQQRKSIPVHVDDAVHTALEKLPADRFASAAHFAEALSGARASEGRRSATAVVSGRGVVPRLDWRVALGIGVLFGAVIGWLARPAPPQVHALPLLVDVLPDSLVLATPCCSRLMAISPDGRQLVFVAMRGGALHLFARNLHEREARPIAGTEGAVEVFFSPDGAWIGFRTRPDIAAGSAQFELRKVAAGGGTPATIALIPGRNAFGATWTDDNVIVYSADGALYKIPVAGGTPARLGLTDSLYYHPMYLPDADALLLSMGPAVPESRTVLLSLRDGTQRLLGPGVGAAYRRSGHLVFSIGTSAYAQRSDPKSGRVTDSAFVIATGLRSARDFAISDQGMLLYASGHANAIIDQVDRGGTARPLPVQIQGADHFDNPDYSPDGKQLAVVAALSDGHQIVVFDLERKTNLRLTFSGHNEFFDWTADGRNLVYVRDNAFYMQPADRSAPERALATPAGTGGFSGVTLGGRWIAYASRATAAARGSGSRGADSSAQNSIDIFIAPFDSLASAKPYQSTRFEELSPAISPDGKWLAWVSDETGRREVYASSVPVAGARIAISSEGAGEPIWSSDSRTLYYRTLAGGVVAVALRPGVTPAEVSRQTLFRTTFELSINSADWAVHPSGAPFIMLRARNEETRLLVATDVFARASGGNR